MNIVVLRGVLSRDADRRTLASATVLLHPDLSTPTVSGVATVPVVWDQRTGRKAQLTCGACKARFDATRAPCAFLPFTATSWLHPQPC